MVGVKYIGPVGDFSGYGEASRNYILSLNAKGVPITVTPRNFDPSPPPIADKEKKEELERLIDKNIPYDIVIIHLTPDLYPRYIERGKYNIGFAAWETSRIHPKWVQSISAVDEMWVPCDCNVDALVDSGVSVPVHKVPHGIDPLMFAGAEAHKFTIKDLSDSTFVFYSIFQWINRKNPEGLLRAYFNAFDDTDDVALVLKTYRAGVSRDKEFVRNQILEIKKDMNIGRYPRVILIGDILSRSQLQGIHLRGDSCVGLHRGEGWGLPLFEAGLAGNPVIATGYGGNVEFMKPDNSYLVDYGMTFVSGMASFNPWYLGNQQWAEPNQVHASELMSHVFNNREEGTEKGRLLKEYICNNFSWDKVASVMVDRLSNIR